MSPQYDELRPTGGWDRFTSLGYPCKFQRLLCLGSVTARQWSSERQPNFAALNRWRQLCSTGQPSRWALAHISSLFVYFNISDKQRAQASHIFIHHNGRKKTTKQKTSKERKNSTKLNYLKYKIRYLATYRYQQYRVAFLTWRSSISSNDLNVERCLICRISILEECFYVVTIYSALWGVLFGRSLKAHPK